MPSTFPAPHETYLKQMVEVKKRLRALDWILGAKKPLIRNQEIDHECAFLQIRKIIELITFSAIVSDEHRYKRLRELDAEKNPKDRGNYALDWKAEEILKHLSKISPHFLPIPLGPITELSDGTKHFNEAAAKLTLERLIDIYKKAGGYLHIANPYKLDGVNLDIKKKDAAHEMLIKETRYLKSIIWEHAKIGLAWKPEADPVQLEQGESAWLVWFGNKNTDSVEMKLAKAI